MTHSTGLALITGATAGLGAEFARQLAARGNDVILVARDRQRLEATATELRALGVLVEVHAADLLTADGVAGVAKRLAATENPVTILVNNAGYGLAEPFERNTVDAEVDNLHLLVEVPLRLTHAALDQMLPRRAGTIINVASVAGYSPRETYGASKAWLLSFTRWAHAHYRDLGVNVMAVAPGFVHTEFHARMDVSTSRVPGILWLNAPFVVRSTLRAAARGRAVIVPSVRYKFLSWVASTLPQQWVATASNGR